MLLPTSFPYGYRHGREPDLSHGAAFYARLNPRTRSDAIEKKNGSKKHQVLPRYEFTATECADDNMVNNVILLKQTGNE